MQDDMSRALERDAARLQEEQRPGMDDTMQQEQQAPLRASARVGKAIGPEQLKKFTDVLLRYKAGKARTEARIIASENWWKLRNNTEEQKDTRIGKDGNFVSRSGWLHNVIESKHADMIAAYPEPNVRPRESADQQEAKMLSSILPCIMEHNKFKKVYDSNTWNKCKFGTGVYKVTWDTGLLNGMGDISVTGANILNLYWEPGIADIQKSPYFFHTELRHKDELIEQHPELDGKIKGKSIISSRFQYDDTVDTTDMVTVVEVYYHKRVNGQQVLQYCQYVDDQVLFASENENSPQAGMDGSQKPSMAQAGLYDHGRYPYVFDPLFPIEGSPCGYGYVDLCRSPQTEIDLIKTSLVKHAMVSATPRYFSQSDGNINEEELLDLSKPIVHVRGGVDETSLREIQNASMDSNILNSINMAITELRETSGNTETATGSTAGGVTAASAIAALQEAAGKGSRAATDASYSAYEEIIELCIELIRQFYDLPRQFRIVGEMGQDEFVTYTNQGLQPQDQGMAFGQHMGYRKPVFDIKVNAQKASVYTKVSQNELALQFYQLGFFNPQQTDQALMCLQMMDFDEKDTIMQGIARNGTMLQALQQIGTMAMQLAMQTGNAMLAQQIGMQMQSLGAMPMMAAPAAGAAPSMPESDAIAGIEQSEPTIVQKARSRAQNAGQPNEGGVTGGKG